MNKKPILSILFIVFFLTKALSQVEFVKDIDTILDPTSDSNPKCFTELNGHLFFIANNQFGTMIFKTDFNQPNLEILLSSTNSYIGNPEELFKIGNLIFFTAVTNQHGRELWRTDGTNNGTFMVKDLRPGTASSTVGNFTEFNGSLFFTAYSGPSLTDYVLWKTDGTEMGTEIVSDVNNSSGFLGNFKVFNGNLYFSCYDQFNVSRIWKSDGTDAGTFVFSTSCMNAKYFTTFQNQLFFQAENSFGIELWKTNGSTLSLVKDISSGSSSSFPSNFIVHNNELYFNAYSPGLGNELWKTDGTTAGTVLFKDIYPGSNSGNPGVFCSLDSILYFSASSTSGSSVLWRTNGSTAGTFKMIGSDSTQILLPQNLVKCDQSILFSAKNNLNGWELWTTNGTIQGTHQVKDINVGIQNSSPTNLYYLQQQLFFAANNGLNGIELWKSDGTSNGTQLYIDVYNSTGSYINNITPLDSEIVFIANGFSNNPQLWRTDGTGQGTELVFNFLQEGPSALFKADNQVFFAAGDNAYSSTELWESDGTINGTSQVIDLSPGTYSSSNPRSFVKVNSNVFFAANLNAQFPHIFSLDLNTGVVNQQTDNIYYTFPTNQNQILFQLNDGVCFKGLDNELWFCQPNGQTALLKDINPNGSGTPSNFISFQNKVYFVANDGINGNELWVSDGTVNGTHLVVDLAPGVQSSSPKNLVKIDEYLYFNANYVYAYSDVGSELWRLNTVTGVLNKVKTFNTGYATNLTKFSNKVIFRLSRYFSSSFLPELWISDGTEIGTNHIIDLQFNSSYYDEKNSMLVESDSLVYFVNRSGYSSQLWRTNGTKCGTMPVSSLSNQISDAHIQNITAFDHEVFFSGIEFNTGFELWKYVPENFVTNEQSIQTCDAFIWNGQSIDTSGEYCSVLTSSNGIDSIVTLIVDFSTDTIINVAVCDNYYWPLSDSTYDTTGVYEFLLSTNQGCDSIVILNLTILNSTSSTETVASCDSFIWPINNQVYTSSGQYVDTIPNSVGCDSIITLNLTIYPSSIDTFLVSACGSYLWNANNQTYTQSGLYTDTLTNQYGCDSIVTLDLTIIPTLPLTINNSFSLPSDANVCAGELAVTVSGNADFELDLDNGTQLLTSSGYTLINNLCPGVHDLLVTDNCGDTLSTQFVIPVDSNYVFNNPFIDSIAADSLGTTITNCDIYYNSIDTAYIDSIWATGNTVNVIWNIVDSNGSNLDTTTYVLNNGNGVYWLQLSVFCPTKALGDYFTVTQAIYFENGMATVGMQENSNIQNITIYPNPTNSYVTIAFDDSEAHLHVTDAQGKRVFTGTIHSGEQLLLEQMETGVYFFEVITEKGSVVKRVVKQ